MTITPLDDKGQAVGPYFQALFIGDLKKNSSKEFSERLAMSPLSLRERIRSVKIELSEKLSRCVEA